MDIGNFVPQYVRDYYDSSGNDNRELNTSKETREPYKAVSNKSSNSKMSRSDKRRTQQFDFSRNRNYSYCVYNSFIVQPLKDITRNESNNNNQFLDSFNANDPILSGQKMNTMKLDTRPTLPSNKFSCAAEFGQKHSSRSLANRIKNAQNDQKIDFYSYTQKLQNDTLISSEKSIDNSISYQHSDYNNTHKNKYQEYFNTISDHDQSSETGSEITQLRQKLNATEVSYMRWKK
jgi:hypothetical protein